MIRTRFGWASALACLAAIALAGCGGGGGGGGNGGGGGGASLGALTLTAKDNPSHTIDLSWTTPTASNTTISNYDVLRATSASGPFAVIGSPIPVGTNAYTDAAVTGITPYYYEVRANAAAAGVNKNSNTAGSTPVGPAAFGLGDPAKNCSQSQPCGPVAPPVFQSVSASYATSASQLDAAHNFFTVDITPPAGTTFSISDLQSVEFEGNVFDTSSGSGVSLVGGHLHFSSVAAGVPVSKLYAPMQQNAFYTFIVTLKGQQFEMTYNAPARTGAIAENVLITGETNSRTFEFDFQINP